MTTLPPLPAELAKRLRAVDRDPEDIFLRATFKDGGHLTLLEEWEREALEPSKDEEADALARACPLSDDVPFPGPLPILPAGYPMGPVGWKVDTKYPFPRMAVGQSFPMPLDRPPHLVRAAAQYFAAMSRARFRFRRGRCWRVA